MLQRNLARVWRRQLSVAGDSLAGREAHRVRLEAAYRLVLGAGNSDVIRVTPEQERAVSVAVNGFSVFLHLPTGAGKSLAFQVPALVAPPNTTTVVVSPLIALMHDQVANLRRKGVDAVHISAGAQLNQKRKTRLADLLANKRLIYTTPEFLMQNTEMQEWVASLRERNGLSRLVLDEAHCILEWGKSFRPSYLEFCRWRARHFPDVPVTLATATAHEDDILTLAGMVNAKVITAAEETRQDDATMVPHSAKMVLVQRVSDRPNLRLEVVNKTNTNTAAFIQDRVGRDPTIVYCLTRREAEKLCMELIRIGSQAGVYHGGLSHKRREFVRRQWMGGQISLICSTNAFGMGIDRADVRFVVHHTMPISLSSYSQQIGRAGRDGEFATCLLLYSSEDKCRAHSIASERVDFDGTVLWRGASHVDVEEVASFCETADCRREYISAYFGHSLGGECSRNCNCGPLGEIGGKQYWTEVGNNRDDAQALSDPVRVSFEDQEPSVTTVEYYYQRVLAETRRLKLPKREGLSRRVIRDVLKMEPVSVHEMAELRGIGFEKAERFHHIFSFT